MSAVNVITRAPFIFQQHSITSSHIVDYLKCWKPCRKSVTHTKEVGVVQFPLRSYRRAFEVIIMRKQLLLLLAAPTRWYESSRTYSNAPQVNHGRKTNVFLLALEFKSAFAPAKGRSHLSLGLRMAFLSPSWLGQLGKSWVPHLKPLDVIHCMQSNQDEAIGAKVDKACDST